MTDRNSDQTPAPQPDTKSQLQAPQPKHAPLPEHAPTPEPSATIPETLQESAPMLEIHPPHHAASTWRDFFIHIATIVIGLLIAIGLEQTVEHIHHRHLLHQARENLREEIRNNQALLVQDRRYLESNRKTMLNNIAILRQLKANPKQAHPPIHFPWQWSAPLAAAWNTARDTGAIALMPYDQVQNYSDLYGQQNRVNDQATVYIANQNHAAVPLVGVDEKAILTDAQIDELIRGCATSDLDISYLEDLMQSLDGNYAAMLKTF